MFITNLTDVDYWFGPMHLPPGPNTTIELDDTTDTSLYLLNDEVADAVNTLYLSSNITVSSAASPFPRPTGTPSLLHGDGSPQGLVYAPQGSLYMRRDSTHASTGLYTKTTGVTVNTGWVNVITPSMELIDQKVVPPTPAQSTITLSSIPQSYQSLKIVASLGNTSATLNPSILMTTSAASGSDYSYQELRVLNGTVSGVSTPNFTSAPVGQVPITSYLGATEITLADYASGGNVPFLATSGATNPSFAFSQYTTGVIAAASAISDITLALNSGDFSPGSTVTLYGLVGTVPS